VNPVSDTPADKEPSARVPVAAAWLAEMRRRQAEYAARRMRWTEAFHRGEPPEPPTDTDAPSRSGRTIHDRRQFRLDL
jgi:hypothetical protein